ncbi:MAG: gamma-glutamyl-gamma-aminobutyrate hydrolase family protein [Bacteroidetes bacterium]|nr:gamma-glutamyl-gamma-aminobutyrate hydrolase family protein [Bacteroidota bacterium]
MRILIIEHALHESPGIILNWISENKHYCKIVRPFLGESLPDQNDFDFLIIMGGPQSPRETDLYPYLLEEIKLTQTSIKNNKHILGICLGAQIISEALGNKTQKSNFKEYGFYPVEFTKEALLSNAFKDFPSKLNTLHWHNDMPGLSDNLIVAGNSEGCQVQGIIYNENIIGLQFHMEIRREDVEGLILFDKETLLEADKFIMPAEEIRKFDFETMNSFMKKFLDNFTMKNI